MGRRTVQVDYGETVRMMEPMVLSPGDDGMDRLVHLVVDMDRGNGDLQRLLPEALKRPLIALLRVVDAHFGDAMGMLHPLHPEDIEGGLQGRFLNCARDRARQCEAVAHVRAAEWLDRETANYHPAGEYVLGTLHRLLGEEGFPENRPAFDPGRYRRDTVSVGAHDPVGPEDVPRCMRRFEDTYTVLSPSDTMMNAAAMHHRLLWIHPFRDGNGRAARLVTRQFLSGAMGSLYWSLARGLALEKPAYFSFLKVCDRGRFDSRDGPGPLSRGALVAFTEWFLTACIGQIGFMTECCTPSVLQDRIRRWAAEEEAAGRLPEESGTVLVAAMDEGCLTRGRVGEIAGRGIHHGRLIVKMLQARGLLATRHGPRSPLHPALPVSAARAWFPGLFPALQQAEEGKAA